MALVGLMASGKTSLGRALSVQLGRPFVDNDEQLLALTGCSARDYELEHGRAALHEAELDALRHALASEEPSVIAGAASIVDTDAGRDALVDRAYVAWIDAPPAVLAARTAVERGDRPAGTDVDALTAQRDQRAMRLEAVADIIVSSDQSIEHSLDQLVRWARGLDAGGGRLTT